MTSEQLVAGIEGHAWEVVEEALGARGDLLAAIEQALPRLDAEARSIAVASVAIRGGPGAGELLLRLTADPEAQVAAEAATAMGKLAQVLPADTVLAAIPDRPEPFVRGELYKTVGRSRDARCRPALQAAAAREQDPVAAQWAQAALVVLGDPEARKAMLARVAAAEPDEALAVQDQLLYAADSTLARGLAPWLASSLTVMRLGSDRGPPQMARMCDLAVWIAHLLRVPSAPAPAFLDRYDEATIDRTREALRALP